MLKRADESVLAMVSVSAMGHSLVCYSERRMMSESSWILTHGQALGNEAQVE